MRIYTRGTAEIEHYVDNEVYTIDADELDWEVVATEEKSMGPEVVYEASVDHPELGVITWTLSEYPAGVENYNTTDPGDNYLHNDVDYGLEPDIEEDFSIEDLPSVVAEHRAWVRSLSVHTVANFIASWFGHFYEDPAQETPYNSEEGGYLYIHGGPYDAEEEIRAVFESLVPDSAINLAVEEVQKNGTIEWAPSPNHPDQRRAYEEAMREEAEIRPPSLEELSRTASVQPPNGLGTDEELRKREVLKEDLKALRTSLPELRVHGGIGHNNPPDEFAIRGEELEQVRSVLDFLESELEKERPEVAEVAERSLVLKRALSWLGGKFDKSADAFVEQLGKSAGRIAIPAILAHPYWADIANVIGSLHQWVPAALGN